MKHLPETFCILLTITDALPKQETDAQYRARKLLEKVREERAADQAARERREAERASRDQQDANATGDREDGHRKLMRELEQMNRELKEKIERDQKRLQDRLEDLRRTDKARGRQGPTSADH